MKIFRPLKLALLPRMDADASELLVTLLVGFDISGSLLTEPEMWRTVGEDVAIDMLAAKSHGELCVWGVDRDAELRVRLGAIDHTARGDAFQGTPIEAEGFFAGDETIHLGDTIEGALPSVTTRVVARMEDETTVDVDTRLDTVVLLAPERRGVAIFRGSLSCNDDEGQDIVAIAAALERLGAPKDRGHYETVIAQRLDPERGHLYAFRDCDLLPEGEPSGLELEGGDALGAVQAERRAAEELDRARQSLIAQGIDPDEHLPREMPEAPEAPTPENLPSYIDQLEAEAEQNARDAEEQQREATARAEAICQEHGIDQNALRDESGGPPKPVHQLIAAMRDEAQLGRHASIAMSDVESRLADPALAAKLDEAYQAQVEAYRRFAQHMPSAPLCDVETSARRRAAIEAAAPALSGVDLTGVDLRGIDLSGADLSDAFLERANLNGASLCGADLSRAVLTRADLSGADLAGARLAQANLGQADLSGACLDRVDGADIVLHGATLDNTSLKQASLPRADLSEARIDGADFAEADLSDVRFIDVDLAGEALRGVSLRRALLLSAKLDGADLREADLERVGMFKTSAVATDLRQANASRLCVVGESDFSNADLRAATLDKACFLDVSLAGADLSAASLAGGCFNKSDLRGAKLYRAAAQGAMFIGAGLQEADLNGANLMQANLMKAALEGASLEGANLFRADVSRSRVDDHTRFDDALMTSSQNEEQVTS